MKITEVVAALIWRDNKFMICQRPTHKARGLLWEFVGGKVESGETKEQALIRECREELNVTLSVGDVEYLTLVGAQHHMGVGEQSNVGQVGLKGGAHPGRAVLDGSALDGSVREVIEGPPVPADDRIFCFQQNLLRFQKVGLLRPAVVPAKRQRLVCQLPE